MLKKLYLWTAVSWSVMIAFLCLVHLQQAPFKSVSNIDKLVHILFHFVFTILWFLYFNEQQNKGKYSKSLSTSFVLSFLFGITIEFLQETLTTTRHADLYDVFANLVGASIAFVVMFFMLKYSGFRIKK